MREVVLHMERQRTNAIRQLEAHGGVVRDDQRRLDARKVKRLRRRKQRNRRTGGGFAHRRVRHVAQRLEYEVAVNFVRYDRHPVPIRQLKMPSDLPHRFASLRPGQNRLIHTTTYLRRHPSVHRRSHKLGRNRIT